MQYVTGLEADVLNSQMAGYVVGHLAQRPREVHAQQSLLVTQRKIFERIERVVANFGDVGIVRKHEGQLLLEHQDAGGDRCDDVVTASDHREQLRDVVVLEPLYGLQVSQLEFGHSATRFPLRERHFDAVVLEDTGEIQPDLRLIAIDVAGGKQRHFSARAAGRPGNAAGWTMRQLFARRIRNIRGHGGVGMHVEDGIQQFASKGAFVDRVDGFHDDGNARDRAHGIGGTQDLVAPACAAAAMFHRLGAQHEMRKIDIPRVRRHIRTLRHVAHVAQVTMVDHLAVVLLVHAVDFAGLRGVDQVE